MFLIIRVLLWHTLAMYGFNSIPHDPRAGPCGSDDALPSADEHARVRSAILRGVLALPDRVSLLRHPAARRVRAVCVGIALKGITDA